LVAFTHVCKAYFFVDFDVFIHRLALFFDKFKGECRTKCTNMDIPWMTIFLNS
jgi:hypothetical protein